MPQSSCRLRQRRNEAARHARAMDSNEARAARLTRDATRVTRRRAAKTDEEGTARLADNTGREARCRAEETDEERTARLQTTLDVRQGAVQKKRVRAHTHGHVRANERPVWLLFLARGLIFFCFVLFARTATHVWAHECEGTACVVVCFIFFCTYGHALTGTRTGTY